MTKPTKWHVSPAKTQISLGVSAWTSAQSDQSLRCPHKETLGLSYPLSAQRRLWSAWASAQADLSLRWAHMPFCRFCHTPAHFISSPELSQDELLWSLFVRRPSVRPSVNIFKRLLWSPWANFAQISYGASLGWENEKLLKWSRSIDQDGRHTHIW